jgi:hypothetical protein
MATQTIYAQLFLPPNQNFIFMNILPNPPREVALELYIYASHMQQEKQKALQNENAYKLSKFKKTLQNDKTYKLRNLYDTRRSFRNVLNWWMIKTRKDWIKQASHRSSGP